MSPPPRCFRFNAERQALPQVRNLPSVTELSGRKMLLRLPHSAQRPLDPWTLFLHERLNVPEGEMVWNHYLHAVGVDEDSRM